MSNTPNYGKEFSEIVDNVIEANNARVALEQSITLSGVVYTDRLTRETLDLFGLEYSRETNKSFHSVELSYDIEDRDTAQRVGSMATQGVMYRAQLSVFKRSPGINRTVYHRGSMEAVSSTRVLEIAEAEEVVLWLRSPLSRPTLSETIFTTLMPDEQEQVEADRKRADDLDEDLREMRERRRRLDHMPTMHAMDDFKHVYGPQRRF